MGQLKLPKLPARCHDEITVTIEGDLKRALEEYASLYQSSYGDQVAVQDLVPAILTEFLRNDGIALDRRSQGDASVVHEGPHERARSPFSDEDPPERLIPLKQVTSLIGLGKTSIYNMIQDGRFPAPYKLSPGAARWSEGEILAWIATRKGDRAEYVNRRGILTPYRADRLPKLTP